MFTGTLTVFLGVSSLLYESGFLRLYGWKTQISQVSHESGTTGEQSHIYVLESCIYLLGVSRI